MSLSHDDVREILRIIDESEIDELLVETERFSLHVVRGASGMGVSPIPARGRSAGSEETPLSDATFDAANGLVTIESPMLGTFYRAEAPGAAPFVEVGAEVGPETTVCIVEVMKMMNSVPAGLSGTIEEVVAENGQLVEFGEPLFRVRVDGGDGD